MVKLIKRLAAVVLITIGLTTVLLGIAAAAGILVVVACPFIALAMGIEYWEKSK